MNRRKPPVLDYKSAEEGAPRRDDMPVRNQIGATLDDIGGFVKTTFSSGWDIVVWAIIELFFSL